MKLSSAIDEFVRDWRSQGRMTSDATERSYRSTLNKHLEDVGNRDPAYIGREDVKKTLRRWGNPNTQRISRSVLVSFYDWAMEEGYRNDNPARQTRRPKKRPTKKYRLTRSEARAILLATESRRERWAIYLLLCAGLRNAECRGLKGCHFERPGFVHVSADIAKGGTERWVPLIGELVPIVAEIRFNVHDDEYVLPAQRWRDPPFNRQQADLRYRRSSSQALRKLVMEISARAGVREHITPHSLRHAYAEHIARHVGIRNAQHLLGHAGIATTEIYVGKPTLDDLAHAVEGFAFGADDRTDVLGGPEAPSQPSKATTGIEPVYTALQAAA